MEDFKEFLSNFETANRTVVKAPFNFRTNYNAIKVIFDGIVNIGPDTTKVKKFLYSYDAESATGRLRFDANGDAEGLNLGMACKLSSESASTKVLSQRVASCPETGTLF